MKGGRQCVNCGTLNPANANFCSSCGGSQFREVLQQPASVPSAPPTVARNVAVRLSLTRVIGVSIVSFGLYFFYWFYLTWKQLRDEMGREHYPVWHALTLLVPIYGLFRVHAHVRLINELARGAGVGAYMSAGVAVALFIGSGVFQGIAARASLAEVPQALSIAFDLIGLALVIILATLAQIILNSYWQTARGSELREAPLGVGEVVFSLLGILAWVLTFLPIG